MKILKEFKEFISRGNVLDMAVGVVVGASFTAIVNSLVKDVFTPCISLITGKFDFSKLQFVINENLSITYGAFIQAIINFIITAFAVFMLVKIANNLKSLTKREEEKKKEEAAPPAPSAEELLLTEIRDLLKEQK